MPISSEKFIKFISEQIHTTTQILCYYRRQILEDQTPEYMDELHTKISECLGIIATYESILDILPEMEYKK